MVAADNVFNMGLCLESPIKREGVTLISLFYMKIVGYVVFPSIWPSCSSGENHT